MTRITRTMTIMLAGAALPLLAGCGASEIASPGTGGNVIINPGTSTPTPTPGTGTGNVTPAGGCPTTTTDGGTVTGPTGTWRVCNLPSIISSSITLAKIPGLVYQMNGRVNVGCDGGRIVPGTGSGSTPNAPYISTTVGCTAANGFAINGSGQLTADTNVTLTIAPGVIILGGTGNAWLAVNRGNKINATGTATQPIIFTSRDNMLGLNSDSSIGQWGGVVLMGRGLVTDCTTGVTSTTLSAHTCERQTEGAADPATFGGIDATYNAGTMKYVQIRYSGFVLGANVELQALTTEGTGSGTTLEYIQSHNSSDDGAEFFGGTVRFKHYIATGADDDSLDADTGADSAFQHVLIVQRPGQGDALMEIDSNNFETDTPRQNLKVANFTAIQSAVSSNNEANDQASILLRGNSDTTLVNGIVISPNNECIRMNGSGSLADRATLVARSVVMQCNGTKYIGSGSAGILFTASDVAAAFGSGSNNNNDAYTPSLTSLFINGATETAVAAIDPKTINAFFDTTTWIGAVKDANDSWYKGWTCNSGYAPFDDTANSNRSCTSLPTT